MKRLSTAELKSLRDNEDWRGLWQAAIPWVKFAASALRANDPENMLQEGLLAMGKQVPKWDPARGAFSSFVMIRAKSAMLESQRKAIRYDARTVDLEASAPEELGEWAPPAATYGDTDHTPEGFGDAATEIARWCAPESAEKLLGCLPDSTAVMLREIMGLATIDETEDAEPVTTVRRRRGVAHSSMYVKINSALEQMDNYQRGSHVTQTSELYPPEGREPWVTHRPTNRLPGFWDLGVQSVMGDTDAWRESVGSVWKDWSWRPTDSDIMRGAKR